MTWRRMMEQAMKVCDFMNFEEAAELAKIRKRWWDTVRAVEVKWIMGQSYIENNLPCHLVVDHTMLKHSLQQLALLSSSV